jgi:probable addiction module antidote protein
VAPQPERRPISIAHCSENCSHSSRTFRDAKFFDGVGEFRVDYGAGYRVYFAQQDKMIVILLCGGDKSTQQKDIAKAQKMAKEFDMTIETTPFDASEFIGTSEAQIELLSDAFETGDPAYIAHALGLVAKARGMSAVAKEAGVTRETLYKALSENGDPRLSTFMGVAKALGLRLQLSPVPEKRKVSTKSAPSKDPQPARKKTIKAA